MTSERHVAGLALPLHHRARPQHRAVAVQPRLGLVGREQVAVGPPLGARHARDPSQARLTTR